VIDVCGIEQRDQHIHVEQCPHQMRRCDTCTPCLRSSPVHEANKLVGNFKLFTDAILRGFQLYKPVIAAVNGNALGGGTEMTNACDLRVAAEHATFGTPEAKVGLLPGGGSISRLPRQIPYAKAMEILLIGDPLSAREALELGLVNYVVPKEELLNKARELARISSASEFIRIFQENNTKGGGIYPAGGLGEDVHCVCRCG
jgi:enoyl-CoA hydratase/carnithine racemase